MMHPLRLLRRTLQLPFYYFFHRSSREKDYHGNDEQRGSARFVLPFHLSSLPRPTLTPTNSARFRLSHHPWKCRSTPCRLCLLLPCFLLLMLLVVFSLLPAHHP